MEQSKKQYYGTADKLRERQLARMRGAKQFGTKFIFKGYNSIQITNDAGQSVQAVVVSQQEKDKGYIYTQLQDSLSIGSIWQSKSLHWLITEEIEVIKDVNWHKYLCFLCNTNLDGYWGYFQGPEASYINVKLNNTAITTSQQKPLLIMPANVLEFKEKIIIKGRP